MRRGFFVGIIGVALTAWASTAVLAQGRVNNDQPSSGQADDAAADAREQFEAMEKISQAIAREGGKLAQTAKKFDDFSATHGGPSGIAVAAAAKGDACRPFPGMIEIDFKEQVTTKDQALAILRKYDMAPSSGLDRYILAGNGWKSSGKHLSRYDLAMPCPPGKEEATANLVKSDVDVSDAHQYMACNNF